MNTKQDGSEEYVVDEKALRAADAARYASDLFHDSSFVSLAKFDELPRFDYDEIILGSLLGRGGFSDVYEIKGFNGLRRSARMSQIMMCSPSDLTEEAPTKDKLSSSFKISYREIPIPEKEYESKKFIAKHCLREESGNNARYAIKFLNENTTVGDIFSQGAADLVIEAYILSNLSHPNIVRLRGISGSGVDGFASSSSKAGYFIVMDRLYGTLEERLKTWAIKNKKHKLLHYKITNKKAEKAFLADRLNAAFDIAGALLHLHKNSIIYRDLKPENVGFDIRGDVKIFDFGLSKELSQHEMNEDETYHLSINTGTRRYMAPEVAKGLPYNKSADVYSFGVLLFQMCHLKKPWKKYNYAKHEDLVIYGKKRPAIDKTLPIFVQTVIETSWDDSWQNREDFHYIVDVLKKEVRNLRSGDVSGLNHEVRRSTFVFNYLTQLSKRSIYN